MFGMTKAVVGLDVGSYAVKAVALQANKERITLQGYAQSRIGTQDPAVVIRKVIDDLGVKPRHLVSSVSGRSVIVRQVETPRLGQEELKAHIAYEADKYIPFGSDEVIIDCQPLPDRADGKAANMQVLLVAVRRGFVEDHIALLRSAGLSPEVIDVDVFALANAYELLGPGETPPAEGQADAKPAATALIDIGASKSNIAIVQGTRLLFTREVYLAGNEVTDAIVRTFNEPAEDVERIKAAPGEALEALLDAAMPAFEDLANEIRLSFDYVEGQFDQQVSNVILTGGSSQLTNIADILGNILGRPVHVFDPLAGMDLVPSRYDLQGLDANSPSLTVALGLAIHLVNSNRSGLGGGQSHGWQPRQSGSGVPRRTPSAPAPAAPAPITAAIPSPQGTPIGNVKPQTRAFEPIQMPSIKTPLPPTFEPLAPPPAPVKDDTMSALDAALDPPQSAEDMLAQDKSGLLVVLDDDQELPASERHEFGTATGKRRTTNVYKIESFEDDDDSKGQKKLPDLPKI